MRMNGLSLLVAVTAALALPAAAQALGPVGGDALLDPETFPIAGGTEEAPAAAFNPSRAEYLVVWAGGWSEGKLEVRSRRLRADGSSAGPVVRLSGTPRYGGSELDSPTVAYDSARDEYLVLWTGAVDPPEADSTRAELFARRVGADGTPIGASFQVTSSLYRAERPAVAFDAQRGRYLVAWDAPPAPRDTGLAIFARTVAPTGELGPQVQVSLAASEGSDGTNAEWPAVARDPANDRFLVVWSSDPRTMGPAWPDTHFYGQLLNGAGGHADAGPDVRLSDGNGLGGNVPLRPSLAHNAVAGEYLAGMSQRPEGGSYESVVQRIAADGQKVPGSSNVVVAHGGDIPSVGYGDGLYLVSWSGEGGQSGLLLDGSANQLGGPELLWPCVFNDLGLTYGSGGWLAAAYTGGRSVTEGLGLADVRAIRLSAAAPPAAGTACGSRSDNSPPPEPPKGDPPSPLGPGSDSSTPSADRVPPRVLSAAIRRVGGRSSVRLRLSESALVEVVLERTEIGRSRGGLCRRTTRHNRRLPRCVLLRPAGSVTTTAGTEERSLVLRRLPAGAYRATLVAVDAAGNESAARVLRFGSPGR
jgi:hypothetical protein